MKQQMNKNTLKHLAIIMDGNGRWATMRGEQRIKGHEKGAEVVREITAYCANHPTVETLTLYAFSTENWKRSKIEVEFLMQLLERWLKNELEAYQKNGVRFEAIGDLSRFSKKLQKRIVNTQEATKDNSKLTQILALNYGSRAEIVDAVNRALADGQEITEENLSHYLQTPYSDIDLLIRTSGELRISNFLLWQLSYSELYFTPTLWPDFTPQELATIIGDFEGRTRRFGGV